ncbi:hypothetical protein C0J52_14555 [Blattella germanica]|nr:hypothetical protein C0J52_14555 [Blattella germanica]
MFFGGDEEDFLETPEPPTQEEDTEYEKFEDVAAELDLGEPTEELIEYARKHLGESPDTKPALLQEFRDLIFERGDVTPHRTDDLFLIRFLRARRFDVEKAHRLMINYYKFKENYPNVHTNVKPKDMRYIGDDGILNVLPYRDQNGRRVLVYKAGNWNPSKYPIEEIFKATVVVLELAVLEQRAQILGGICLIDLEGISVQQAWHITPTLAKMTVELLVTSFPIRIHAIHFVNESWVFDMMFAIFKPFLDERMREKIYIHGHDLDALYSHIDPKFLPKKYGGMRPEYNYTDWLDKLVENKDIVEEMEKLGYDFSLDEVKKVLEDAKSDIAHKMQIKSS